ncbi:MAG: hypothetical protein GZ087_10375 [Flavobacterium sp.]|nr:hypothetical protein [Flavobacterium sp.]
MYKSNGNILNSENQKISPDQVRELLKDNEKLLADYKAGRSKKTVGNVLFIGGSVLILTDMITNLTSKQKLTYSDDISHSIIKVENRIYPSVFTYIGIAAIIVAIPVKIGFSKKIKNVVADYNNQNTTGYKQFNEPKLDLITNSNGIGLRFILN